MIVRLHYADGETEDHELKNGRHFADYIRRVDVPESEFAFPLRGQQIRYLAIHPEADGRDRKDRVHQRPRPHRPRSDGGHSGIVDAPRQSGGTRGPPIQLEPIRKPCDLR